MKKQRILQIKISDEYGVSEAKIHNSKDTDKCCLDILPLSGLSLLSEYINMKLKKRKEDEKTKNDIRRTNI